MCQERTQLGVAYFVVNDATLKENTEQSASVHARMPAPDVRIYCFYIVCQVDTWRNSFNTFSMCVIYFNVGRPGTPHHTDSSVLVGFERFLGSKPPSSSIFLMLLSPDDIAQQSAKVVCWTTS